MNERIKKLAVQGGAHWNYGDHNMRPSIEFQEEDLEKFAELLIRECAKVALDEAHDSYECILAHFGVK